jgi:hypothetical protein
MKRYIALAILILALLACGSTAVSTTAGSGTPQPTDTTAASAPQATPTPKPALQKWTFKGNGTSKTAQFTTNSSTWKLSWSCDPAAYGSEYNLIVDVNGTDGSSIDTPVNVICKSGVTSGSSMEYNAQGTYYLSINSEASWSIHIQEQ